MYARLFNCAAASLPRRLLRTYLESCANIVQAVVYCPPSCRQSVKRHVRSRNPSKSTLAHHAVTTAVLHKHHLIIRVGAGLIQFVYRSHLRLATEVTRNRNAFSPLFARVHRIAWSQQFCLLTSGRTNVAWAFFRHFTPPGPFARCWKGSRGRSLVE